MCVVFISQKSYTKNHGNFIGYYHFLWQQLQYPFAKQIDCYFCHLMPPEERLYNYSYGQEKHSFTYTHTNSYSLLHTLPSGYCCYSHSFWKTSTSKKFHFQKFINFMSTRFLLFTIFAHILYVFMLITQQLWRLGQGRPNAKGYRVNVVAVGMEEKGPK